MQRYQQRSLEMVLPCYAMILYGTVCVSLCVCVSVSVSVCVSVCVQVMKENLCPSDEDWRELVIVKSRQIMHRAVAGLLPGAEAAAARL